MAETQSDAYCAALEYMSQSLPSEIPIILPPADWSEKFKKRDQTEEEQIKIIDAYKEKMEKLEKELQGFPKKHSIFDIKRISLESFSFRTETEKLVSPKSDVIAIRVYEYFRLNVVPVEQR